MITQAQTSHFYGSLHIIFENGQAKRVIKEESILPPGK
jgi:hypothetical protein